MVLPVVKVPVFVLPNVVTPVTPAEPDPILPIVMSAVWPAVALISRVVRA